jgi:probable rRNA maturation factor
VSTAAVGIVVDRRVHLPGPLRRALARRLRRLVGPGASVELRVCDDAAMAELHAAHLGSRRPTDVLSFPSEPLPGGDDGEIGQIVVDWDAVRRQAARADAAGQLAEATSLLVHAVAHLHGHDHDTRARARRMLAAERRLGRRLGVAVERPYGGRR